VLELLHRVGTRLAPNSCSAPQIIQASGARPATKHQGLVEVAIAVAVFGASLGADGEEARQECGKTALNFLLSPQRDPGEEPHGPCRSCCACGACLGLFVFFYAVVHFTVYWCSIWAELGAGGADIVKRPTSPSAFSALLLLVRWALTSTNGMMGAWAGAGKSCTAHLRDRSLAVCILLQVKRDVRSRSFMWNARAAVRVSPGALALRSAPRGERATAAPAAVTSRSGSATAPERT